MLSNALLGLVLVGLVNAQTGPLVNITQGFVRGAVATDGNYYTFHGIPYGGPTSLQNRFKPPTAPPHFDGIFNATDNNILCAQPGPAGIVGVEDCLTLSIFTNTSLTIPKPVLVWLIGEEYTTSNPVAHSFKRLVEENLVVVAINYRLSVFGFLCLGTVDAPGNAGLRDIVQGLKWIQENIAEFGGDPNNVILFGHGSGAAMVDLITLSPLSEGLIHKAIAHSGSAMAPWAVAYDPIGYANKFAAQFGYAGDSMEHLVGLLKSIQVNTLVSAINNVSFLNNTILFAPCIENAELNPDDTFLPDAPINLLNSAQYYHVPYIAGYTDREGTIRVEQAVNDNWMHLMQEDFSQFLPVDLNLNSASEQAIREFYFGNANIITGNIQEYFNYHGDTMIQVPVIRGASIRRLTSRADVRILEFRYRGTNNSDWPFPDIPLTGVPHGGILNFLLDIDLRERDREVMDSLVTRYVNFAHTGLPTKPDELGPTWTTSNVTTLNYLSYYGGDLTSEVVNWEFGQSPGRNPQTMKMEFWDDIYSRHYVAPRPVSSSEKVSCLILVLIICQCFLRIYK